MTVLVTGPAVLKRDSRHDGQRPREEAPQGAVNISNVFLFVRGPDSNGLIDCGV